MSGPERDKTRVVIYGSCVSRDTFDFLDRNHFQLDRYIARQSLISAYAEATPLNEMDIEPLSSDFQKRTIRDDFRSSLHQDLLTFGHNADVVLWDLTDERYGVWDLGGGQYITRSIELFASGIDQRLMKTARLVPFGSADHLQLWTDALGKFSNSILSADLRLAPILINPPWATFDQRGRLVRGTHGLHPRSANQMFRVYARRAAGISTHTISSRWPLTNSGHQWGRAPYHYTDRTYRRMAKEIALRAGRDPREQSL